MSQQRPTSTLARFQSFLVPVLALVVAFTIGGILISLQGVNPFLAYKSLFSSAWFTSDGLLRTLQKTTPLILTGLAVAIPLKIGLFNIGAQGQLCLLYTSRRESSPTPGRWSQRPSPWSSRRVRSIVIALASS